MIFKDDGKYSGSIAATERRATFSSPKPSSSSFMRVAELSRGETKTGNAIIEGDNVLVLQDMQNWLAGAVRCVYLDPPYNNREEYNHYDDHMEHERWLDSMSQRLHHLVGLLAEDGSVWISIDDREAHYLKVAADIVFGRENFITAIVWQQRTTRENRRAFSVNHEYVLVYAKNAKTFRQRRNLLPAGSELAARYKNPDNDPRGPWQSVSANVQAGHATPSQFYTITGPSGRKHSPPNGRCWVYSKERMKREIALGNVWFGRDGEGVPRLKKFMTSVQGLTPPTLWLASEVGTTDSAKKHLLKMFPKSKVFDTPKPEALLAHILHIATDPDDLVLDAFLGSGTTAAVAHKMGRRYIGIEQSKSAAQLAANRLGKVVRGEAGGVSDQFNWTGGGGFDFYRVK
jgi:adenine-specific DNA-methyltransferase